ncbi:MAG: NIL domain-containing protein [Dehalococcoidia bacterium]|nr:NIL domain-containing protein [Dehalococcoidia bacterium]
MAKQFFKLTFPANLITEPILYDMGKTFNVITNIFRANVTGDSGWVLLQIEGNDSNIEEAVLWTKGRGVQVERVAEDSLQ